MKRRAVITGMGMVSPLANNLPDSWNALIAGKSGIQKYINDPKLKNQKPLNLALVKGFQQKRQAVPHASSRQNGFVVSAAQQSINSAKLNLETQDKSRIGICLGVIGSNTTKITQFAQQSINSTFQNINRLSLLHLISSIPTGVLNVKYKTSGPTLTVNTACASGLSAVLQAAKYIQYDQADIVLSGGVEDSYNPLQIYSALRIQAMTGKQYEKPQYASRPFDKKRSGFVLGEGCGMLVVEQLQHALNRKANILAQILGVGQSSDGYHLVKPMQTGFGQIKAIQQALARSGIKKQQIDFVDTHATSTPTGDQIQANTLKKIFGTHTPYICANKSVVGHTLGAAGAIQLIFAINAMNNSILPSIRNLNEPDVQGLNYVIGQNKKTEINYFLKNSFGFGGVNVCGVLGKYKA